MPTIKNFLIKPLTSHFCDNEQAAHWVLENCYNLGEIEYKMLNHFTKQYYWDWLWDYLQMT